MSHFKEKITSTKAWLYGRLSMYKIKFSETDNNSYLDSMNNYNETINVIKELEGLVEYWHNKANENNIK